MQMASVYMANLFISIDRMPFLATTLANADPLYALVIISGFYLHHVEVADQDPASDSLQIYDKIYYNTPVHTSIGSFEQLFA